MDDARLAAAGCSGGGTQTAYFASVDDRVVTASVACYTSTFIVDYAPKSPDSVALDNGTETSWPLGGGGPADGEQTWGPHVSTGTSAGLDKPDLLVARSPKPTQVLLTTWDTCFPLRGGMFAVNESSGAWASDATAALEYQVEEHWHGYVRRNREHLYEFMTRTLNHTYGCNPTLFEHGVCNSTELYATPFSLPSTSYPYNMPYPPFFTYEQLRTTSTGNVLTAPELSDLNISSAHDALVLPLLNAQLASLAARRRRASVPPAISSGSLGVTGASASGQQFLREVQAQLGDVIGFINPIPRRERDVNATLPGASYTKLIVKGEGHCKLPIKIWPAELSHISRSSTRSNSTVGIGPSAAPRVVLYFARKDPASGQLSKLEMARIALLQRHGLTVATADLCGFGAGGGGDAFGPKATVDSDAAAEMEEADLPTTRNSALGHDMGRRGIIHVGARAQAMLGGAGPGGGPVVDVATNVNRSIVGMHAADVLRVATAVRVALNSSGAIIAATISMNDTAAAVLAATLLQRPAPSQLGDIAIVESVASWEMLARSERYDQGSYYSWVFGVLQHFDLPDLVAAVVATAGRRVMVMAPVGALRQRLSPAATKRAFAFAHACDNGSSLTLQLQARTAAQIDEALLRFATSDS